MFEKLGALWRVFKAGEAVADPVAWKRGQINVAMLTALLGAVVALAKSFGYALLVTDDQLAAIAGGVLAVVGVFNQLATAGSTDKVDVLGRAPAAEAADQPGQHLAREVERANPGGSSASTTGVDSAAPVVRADDPAAFRPVAGVVVADDFDKQREADSQRG